MSKAMEDMRNQVRKEVDREIALRMLRAGKYTLEEIASITELTLDEVKNLSVNQSA